MKRHRRSIVTIAAAVLAGAVFLALGFGVGQWRWAWVVFVAVPITYLIYTVDDRVEKERDALDDKYREAGKRSRHNKRGR